MNEIKICINCVYQKKFKNVNPFGNISVWTPEILKEKTQWEEKQKEAAINEEMRFSSGGDFDYEPINYPWCSKWTEEKDEYALDPVTGNKSKIYMLCARCNTDGKCLYFKKAE